MRSLKQSRDEVRIGMNFHQPPLFFFQISSSLWYLDATFHCSA